MSDAMYPSTTREVAQKRRELSPATEEAFQAFSQNVFAEGALSTRTKQLIAVAVAHVTQCPYCIKGHTKAALCHGASREELMEAIWVAAEMRAGGACSDACHRHRPGLDNAEWDAAVGCASHLGLT